MDDRSSGLSAAKPAAGPSTSTNKIAADLVAAGTATGPSLSATRPLLCRIEILLASLPVGDLRSAHDHCDSKHQGGGREDDRRGPPRSLAARAGAAGHPGRLRYPAFVVRMDPPGDPGDPGPQAGYARRGPQRTAQAPRGGRFHRRRRPREPDRDEPGILLRADFAIVPCKASMLEVRALAKATEVLRQSQDIRNGLPHAVAVLSMVGQKYRLTQDMKDAARALQLPLASSAIDAAADLRGRPGAGRTGLAHGRQGQGSGEGDRSGLLRGDGGRGAATREQCRLHGDKGRGTKE